MKTYPNILNQNIYSQKIEKQFLIIGSCLPDIYPEVVKKFQKKWKNVFSICLEEFHYNQLVAKLFSILSLGKTQKIGFLTVDGSPHCIQIHFASKYLKRGLNKTVDFEHYVMDKKGKIYKISLDTIEKSKNLSIHGEKV
jgi:hypothetical protein